LALERRCMSATRSYLSRAALAHNTGEPDVIQVSLT
jgi:hypothetical protein